MSWRAAGTARFAWTSGLTATAVGAALCPIAMVRGPVVLGWAFAGWVVAVTIAVVFGSWRVAVHGRPGVGFVRAVGAGLLSHLAAVAAGAAIGIIRNMSEAWAYLAGFGAAYVPGQLIEMVWFVRRGR